MPATESTRPRRSHRLGACYTCRRRHVKCDQKRPSCHTCHSYGVPCEGFSSKVRWMHDDNVAGDNADACRPIRQHLYTEQSRSSMSSALGSRLVSGSINASLGEIDLRTRDTADIVVGPFAVFRSVPSDPPKIQSSEPEPQGNPGSDHPPSLPSVLPSEPEMPEHDPTLSMIDSFNNVDDFLQWPDLVDFDYGLSTPLPSLRGALDLQSGSDPGYFDSQIGDGTLYHDPGSTRDMNETIPPHQHANQMAATLLEAAALTNAPHLLKNFNDRVIPLTMPIPLDEKSPWKILNMPSAMVAYGDLTILGSDKISHARQANLYALLACSAYHLALDGSVSSPGSSEYWQGVTKQMAQRGLEHMQLSLKVEMHEPTRAKYKDQLMAICCLTEYAIFSANQKQARAFLTDAEYILRTRGLRKRRISQKARLLHHIYTWQRLVGESTYVLHDHTHTTSVTEAVNTYLPRHSAECLPSQSEPSLNEPVPRLDDFLRLEVPKAGSDLNIDEAKDKQTGLHDIHLQDSRRFPDTLYKEIYGIPETWLSLLSQTTRLANVMETVRKASISPQRRASEILAALHKRSGHLENMICLFHLRNSSQIDSGTVGTPRSQNSLSLAMNAALVIFFYRRVRQVHPVILSSYVDIVIAALSEFDWTDSSGVVAPATVWPIFIAGCEALTSTRRTAILQFLQKAETIYRFPAFKIAVDIMTELWSLQDEHLETNQSDPMTTWTDIIRRRRIWPLFC
ncbi:Transcriptional regulatory protein pro-1 [Talaromyces islandicus]|uniref:Transcriptional regulatory protein pro-1 n=1 Tax=Talaromyces islandicus TaxID=28573 RepID=A0A0U1LMA0_TALIS|nr:Transcriptional regulatory protein pro-1 [Talaromyces islandicus]